jgi:large subunit ribosomal protein L24
VKKAKKNRMAQAHQKPMIKTGDEVQVISGAESGRREPAAEGDTSANPIGLRGRVRSLLLSEGRVVVAGVRNVKKATRPDPKKGHRGGFVEKEAPIPLSNVMLVCRKCDRPVRARMVKDEEGKKTRVCRKCGENI